MKFVCIFTTAPSMAVARKLSRILLQKKIAACIQLVPNLESHYSWKGKTQKSREIQLVIKTRATFSKKVESLLKQNHPYEVPEIIVLPILSGSAAYLQWLSESTQTKD